MTIPRVVLDSNCLISALVFPRGRLGTLRMAWQNGHFTPLVCQATTAELIRVLGYPKFRLSTEDIRAVLADILPWTEVIALRPPALDIPSLRDPDDAVFLHLARDGKADFLVSGDVHLLELTSAYSTPEILPPTEFLLRLNL